mmetsp:Transcript_18988/g.37975  ORF Transcript_18988/g.37975 Transcript_18988/m.37975 type:complete len:295 (-) Transcript_18988:223-1107(-)
MVRDSLADVHHLSLRLLLQLPPVLRVAKGAILAFDLGKLVDDVGVPHYAEGEDEEAEVGEGEGEDPADHGEISEVLVVGAMAEVVRVDAGTASGTLGAAASCVNKGYIIPFIVRLVGDEEGLGGHVDAVVIVNGHGSVPARELQDVSLGGDVLVVLLHAILGVEEVEGAAAAEAVLTAVAVPGGDVAKPLTLVLAAAPPADIIAPVGLVDPREHVVVSTLFPPMYVLQDVADRLHHDESRGDEDEEKGAVNVAEGGVAFLLAELALAPDEPSNQGHHGGSRRQAQPVPKSSRAS